MLFTCIGTNIERKKTNWPQQTTCPKTLMKLQVLKCFLSLPNGQREEFSSCFSHVASSVVGQKIPKKKPSGNERHSIFVFNGQFAMSNGVWAYESYDGHKTNDADEHLSKYSMSQVSFDLFVFCVASPTPTANELNQCGTTDKRTNGTNEEK